MEMLWEGKGLDKECPNPLETVSTPPQTLKWSAYRGRQDESKTPTQSQCTQSSLQKRMQQDECFACGQQGHWRQDCPSRTPKTGSSQPSTPEQDKHQLPVLRCHCKVAYKMLVSHSTSNPGRRFYSRGCDCRDVIKTEQGDRFKSFMWSDNVTAPMCRCHAGACTINFQKHEEEDGTVTYTMYYTCRIRMGHGACDFLHFASPPKSPISRTVLRSLQKDILPSVVSPKHVEPPMHENECPIPSFSNRTLVIREVETCNLVTGNGLRVSRLTSRSEIHSRQIEFLNQISAAAASSNGCKVLQILGLHVDGWVGRLLFLPPRFLADPPFGHFFCCIFPLFDPILVSENMNVSDGGSSRTVHHSLNDKVDEFSENTLWNDTQLMGVPLGTSSRKRSFAAVQEDVTCLVLEPVGKRLQGGLVIQSMKPPHNDTLPQAANAAFKTVQDNCDVQASTEHNNVEECLDDVSGLHSEALALLTASSGVLQSIRKEASHLKDMLVHIEKLLDHFETETSKLETCVLDMQTAYQELRKASKRRQREEGQCMGRTAFEESCSSSGEICMLYLRKRQKIVGNYVNEAE